MRCFVAVTVGARITEAVTATVEVLRDEVAQCGVRVSWTKSEGWHVTLKFLGEISPARAAEVGERVTAVAATNACFPVVAEGVLTLPRGKAPRVLAIGLRDGGRLAGLAAQTEDALAPLGFERERRRFLPHLTIGRVRASRDSRGAGPPALTQAVEAVRDRDFGKGEVDGICLYESVLGRDGASYRRLGHYRLAARGTEAGNRPEESTKVQ